MGLQKYKSPRVDRRTVLRVCEVLERTYGRPRLDNPEAPVDDLIFIILSNKTSPEVAQRTFAQLKQRFAEWDGVIVAPMSVLYKLLRPAGLATVKSRQIRAALRRLKADFGSCDLSALRDMSEAEAQEYLLALPGISEKVAKCVMMYTLGFDVLPVDSHVHRITRRLGWTNRKRADQCHEELESLVSPKRRYAFHVDCVVHGRTICRPTEPSCSKCLIKRYCAYFKTQRTVTRGKS